MESDDDDEFGEIDDQEMMQVATQCELLQTAQQHPPKGRPTNTGPSEGPIHRKTAESSQASSSQSIGRTISSYPRSQQSRSGAAPQAGLRQTTIFGGVVQQSEQTDESRRAHNWPLASTAEPPTHHKLDKEALKTWVYPTNLGTIREYQYTIVYKALFNNILVALPTGLGKTFIAATVMLNWFRWTTDAQIIFVAPTRPLVEQQIEACFGIAGIPRSQTTLLTGNVSPGLRAQEWEKKRVFFMTPQTLANDLRSSICDPKRIVLIVVDEAHRATGAYSYVEAVKLIKKYNSSFRVLALTATPGAKVESVQEVIDGLSIARTEIRTEESMDIRSYVHQRNVDQVVFNPSDDLNLLKDLFAKTLQPIVDNLTQHNAFWQRDPMLLSTFGLVKAQQQWMASDAGRNANRALKGMILSLFGVLTSLSHAISLLTFHGIGPFYHYLVGFRNDFESGKTSGKYRKQINDSDAFQNLMVKCRDLVSGPDFIGHPKLESLQQIVMNHFLDTQSARSAGDDPTATRVMVFVQYRDSAEEIARVLKRHDPLVKPHVFVGQAAANGTGGMSQKIQKEIVGKFKKGDFNTLIATSIGEEGLDIGEVDLIVCYDSSSSPIRMLQRMGRTGRKRAGKIVLLLMRGKEEESYISAKDNYQSIQKLIASGSRFNFHEEESPRIIPREFQPTVDKKHIEIPFENSQHQNESLEPKKGRRPPKRPPKVFRKPPGARDGFVKASRLLGSDQDCSEEDSFREIEDKAFEEEPEYVAPLQEVLLKASEVKELERRYRNVYGSTGLQVGPPKLHAFPERQHTLGPTVRVDHGRITKRYVNMARTISSLGSRQLQSYPLHLHSKDKDMIDKQCSSHKALFYISEAAVPANISDSEDGSSGSAVSRALSQSVRSPRSLVESVSSAEDPDIESDLGGFIDDEELDEKLASAGSTPPPTATRKRLVDRPSLKRQIPDIESSEIDSSAPKRPFYKPATQNSSDSDDALPEFSTNMAIKTSKPEHKYAESPEKPKSPLRKKKKTRNLIIEDSDD
ncbi:MAG: 3'-5' DNA helicase [Trizodia sp. TS-e1964]|nr:MAG: 3'-5' DNA helicase [Trizodia sp. TS-e1964]